MPRAIEDFIARWQGRHGGQERANYALFLTELCDVLGLPHPDPASAAHDENDYVFERVVHEPGRDGSGTHRRIDLCQSARNIDPGSASKTDPSFALPGG